MTSREVIGQNTKVRDFTRINHQLFEYRGGAITTTIVVNDWMTTRLIDALYAEISRLSPTEGWREYPKEKPEKDGWYLITYRGENLPEIIYWKDEWLLMNPEAVIAFMELPPPYSSEKR